MKSREENKKAGAPNEPVKMSVRTEKEIAINRPPSEVYQYWRNFENLPLFMKHIQEVKVMGDAKSHWVFKGPNKSYDWDAEITSDRPNEFISWHSIGNSEIEHAGSVEFRSSGESGTLVKMTLAYNPPAGKAGHALAQILGEAPEQQIDEDLRNLKSSLEQAA